jgi:hypothetical protein
MKLSLCIYIDMLNMQNCLKNSLFVKVKLGGILMKKVIMAIILIQAGILFAQPVDEHTLAYWKINEGSGDFVEDFSSYGNHGTVENATWTTDAKTGGEALEFNGQNSQVTVADSPTLHPQTGDITVGAWIKVFSNPKGWSNGGAIVYKGSAYQWIVNIDGTLWLMRLMLLSGCMWLSTVSLRSITVIRMRR